MMVCLVRRNAIPTKIHKLDDKHYITTHKLSLYYDPVRCCNDVTLSLIHVRLRIGFAKMSYNSLSEQHWFTVGILTLICIDMKMTMHFIACRIHNFTSTQDGLPNHIT